MTDSELQEQANRERDLPQSDKHPLLTPANARIARHVLIALAVDGRTITYSDLADALISLGLPVPARTGQRWAIELGTLLGMVAQTNVARHEPLLSSLVRTKTRGRPGRVGHGYAIPVYELLDVDLSDEGMLVEHSEDQTEKCFGFFWTVQEEL